MIQTLALTKESDLLHNVPLDQLFEQNIKWYWVDFENPTKEEIMLLKDLFNFHHLAIEDCLNFLQRPKLDYYTGYNFFVLHALNQKTLAAEEVDVFISDNFIVTFHWKPSPEIEEVRMNSRSEDRAKDEGINYVFYKIIDKIVDNYFPAVYEIEDQLDQLGIITGNNINDCIEEVFNVRADLFKLRRIAVSMRDLLYRILESKRLEGFKEHSLYYTDIYDHLVRISEMVGSTLDLTSDMRDSYISLNSNRMNKRMTVLTVITSIFAPLTFVAGIYGMNFEYMPELHWRYGYFLIVGMMMLLGSGMYIWFRNKGWLDIFK